MKRKTIASDTSPPHQPSKRRRRGSITAAAIAKTWQDSPQPFSADWVISINSNVQRGAPIKCHFNIVQTDSLLIIVLVLTRNNSICNDRKWFTELTPFLTVVESTFSSGITMVLGVGTVHLPVKRHPDLRGPQAHHLLRLTNVLYAPWSKFNILGSPIFDIAALFSMYSTPKSRGSLTDGNGNPIAFFSPKAPLPCLRLSGPPVGPRLAPSKFEPDAVYILTVTWPGSERARWNARGQQDETEAKPRQRAGEQPYTAEEKEWLKKHYRGEYKFLMTHGLSIYDEEEREEGRAIMRALTREDDEDDGGEEVEEKDKEEEEEEEKEEEEDDDYDEFNNVADCHFDENELAWIKKHYRDSGTFMLSYGLKFYKDKDCADAKRLVKSFMRG
ncbi:hypothetical protein TrVFT333_002274 [Trichoderma virens FT-333]|nr:hypothetical protein TrVFT333_002274 [Trichoderma virens FT-333]